MYGYTAKRVGGIFTHVVNFTQEELNEMSNHSHNYTNSEFDSLQASFFHFTEKEHDKFIEKFAIELVETKKELRFLKQLTQ